MKKLILTLLVTCSFAVLNAQTENNDNKQHRRGGNPAEMVEKRTQDMVKKYALSAPDFINASPKLILVVR